MWGHNAGRAEHVEHRQVVARRGNYYVGEVATSAEDYYTGRGESPGRWVGSLASSIGLEGQVEAEQFRAVLDGRHPFTDEQLAPHRDRRDSTTGRPGREQGTLFDDDTVDVARAASRLRVTVGRVRQLLWAGDAAKRPRMYLAGRHAFRSGGPTQWHIEISELERFEATHLSKKARAGLRPDALATQIGLCPLGTGPGTDQS